MIQYKRRSDDITRIALLVGTTILIHLMLTPMAYTRKQEPASGRSHIPFTLSNEAYIINEVNDFELLSDVKIKSTVSRNLKDLRRLLKRVLDATVQPIITIVILLVYTLTYYKQSYRRKSLLAFSLGGHAPPVR